MGVKNCRTLEKRRGRRGLEYFNQIQNQCDRHSSRVELLEPIFDIELIRHEYRGTHFGLSIQSRKRGDIWIIGSGSYESWLCSFGVFPSMLSGLCISGQCFHYARKRDSFEKTLKKKLTEAIHAEDNISELSLKAYEKALEYEPKKIAQRFLEDFLKK